VYLAKLFDRFLEIKAKKNFQVVDVHVHPLDVLGTKVIQRKTLYKRDPSLLERFEYNAPSLSILKMLFFAFPSYIKREINKKFTNYNIEILEREMQFAGIDRSVLMPVEPLVSTEQVATNFSSRSCSFAGSIDLRRIELDKIEQNIDLQIRKFGIIGFKLHPNIQEFYPQPAMNDKETGLKLERLYEILEARKIFLLFHGGISYMLDGKVRREFANLKNFCSADGNSEVFKYKIPIIIAHFGNYNIARPNFDYIKYIAGRFPNVFFDTSGISPRIVAKGIEVVGIKKVLFGSDAPYFNMKYGLALVLKALLMTNIKEDYDERVSSVLGLNFKEGIKFS